MEFSKAFEELDKLNEEILMEKKWVAIVPKRIAGQTEADDTYYKFLTVDNQRNWKADIKQMLDPHVGTYKQTLDQEIYKELLGKLEAVKNFYHSSSISDSRNFTIISGDELEQLEKLDKDRVKRLTLADRYLRQQAHSNIDAKLKQRKKELEDEHKQQGRESELPRQPIDLQTMGYLVHHISGHEDDNESSNLVLVPYTKGDKEDLKIAAGIHSVLHRVATPEKVKEGPINFDTKIYRLDSRYNLVEGICHITIDLPKVKY